MGRVAVGIARWGDPTVPPKTKTDHVHEAPESMNEPFPSLVISVWRDFRRAWGPLVVYEVLFKLLEAWLVLPAVAVVLSGMLSRSGHIAVTNRDILAFLLSSLGLVYAALFGIVAVALLLLEQAGIMAIADLIGSVKRRRVTQIVRGGGVKTLRIAQLGAFKSALLALTSVPFVVLAVLVYAIFLTGHDINFYLEHRPPVFWLAACLGSVVLAAAIATGMWLYVRWAFALPILVFEGQFARAALRVSRERTDGVAWHLRFILLGWQLGTLLLGVSLQAGFRLLEAAVIEHSGDRPIAVILLLLVIQGGMIAVLSFITAVGQALFTRQLYLIRNQQLGLLQPDGSDSAPDMDQRAPVWIRVPIYVSIAVVVLAPMFAWSELTKPLAGRPAVQVTAHRGHSRAAPENTLSAIKKAIESGADYAEVDVQQTADGVVVLLHDGDLKRVAGVPRKCEELSYDEIRKLDVGAWFAPAFAGERVPSLAEVIDISRGRIRLNIELKLDVSDGRLAAGVARVIGEHRFESDCLVTSFNRDALIDLKRHDPSLRTGLIVAYALGDVSRLEVEALSVRAEGLSDELIRAAHRVGQEVHVWTVNDARQMDRLIKRGVDNIITDDPDILIRIRDDWARLTGTERLLAASRLLLGIDR